MTTAAVPITLLKSRDGRADTSCEGNTVRRRLTTATDGQCQEDEEPWDQYVSDAEDSGTMETKLGFGSALLIISAYKVSEQFDQEVQLNN